jgi:DNA repair protein RadC
VNIVELKYKVREKSGHPFSGPEDLFAVLQGQYNPIQEEFFLLPSVGQEFALEKLFVGGVDCSTVDLRTVFHKLLSKYPNCRAFFVAHNHPSGDVEPSDNDMQLTKHIKEAAKLLGYCLLDHIVFSNKGYYSFSDQGLVSQ